MRILGEGGEHRYPRRRPALVASVGVVALIAAAASSYWLLSLPSRAPAPQRTAQPVARPAGSGTGALEVTADRPGARVLLDGRDLGPAPQRATDLAAGSHRVRVEKEGFPPFEQEVHVIPGREAKIRARVVADPPRVHVDSDVPGASVFLDHKYLGKTPLDVSLSPGSHRLNVSAEGYETQAEALDAESAPRDLMVRFKEVRLDEALDAVHKHALGSCEGRLTATPAGLRYEASRGEDAFALPLSALTRFEVDYLKKNLRVTLRGGKTYNFTAKSGSADALFAFHKNVDAARRRL